MKKYPPKLRFICFKKVRISLWVWEANLVWISVDGILVVEQKHKLVKKCKHLKPHEEKILSIITGLASVVHYILENYSSNGPNFVHSISRRRKWEIVIFMILLLPSQMGGGSYNLGENRGKIMYFSKKSFNPLKIRSLNCSYIRWLVCEQI